jgi:hypothetical protein
LLAQNAAAGDASDTALDTNHDLSVISDERLVFVLIEQT